jgi:hypothetical protein
MYNHSLFLRHVRALGPNCVWSLLGSFDRTDIDAKYFREQPGFRPQLDYRWNDKATTQVFWSWAYGHYNAPQIQAQRRNGTTSALGFMQYYTPDVPKVQLQLRAGYTHTWNNTDGSDFDFESDSYQAGFGLPLYYGVYGNLSYTRVNSSYANPNSIGGFITTRSDGMNAFDFSVSRPLLSWLSASANYDYTDNRSNIGVYTYIQRVISSRLQARF